MQFGFSRKQSFRRRLACKVFITECSRDPYLWEGEEGSRAGQREKVGCDSVLMKVSADLTGTSGARMSRRTVLYIPMLIIGSRVLLEERILRCSSFFQLRSSPKRD